MRRDALNMTVALQCCLLTLALFCIAKSEEQFNSSIQNCLPPSIKKQYGQGTIHFIVNTEVEIPCIAKGSGKLLYSWLKNGEVLDLTSPDVIDRIAMGPETGTLNFKAQETDEGIYQCSVKTECGTSLSKKTSLIFARIVLFPKLDKPTEIKRVVGSSVKLDCKPPKSTPRAKISWVLMSPKSEEGSKDEPLQMDSRITMDYEGSLYITSLRREDEKVEKMYVCKAENMFTRSINFGEDKRITVQGTGTVSDRGVELMWYSGNETMVLVGKTARFKCIFSGHPEPTITWSRVTGGDLEPAQRMTYDGNELVITHVQYKDAGEYQCTGRNSLSLDTKSHIFKLNVEAAPQWKIPPRDMSVGVEESTSLECDATGQPPPTVEWFINGKPFSEVPASPHRTLKDNIMTFSQLETADSLVVQCNASNIHGSIWSDVYLYVQAIAPEIAEGPEPKLVVAEGRDLKVACHVIGKPKPRIIWYKGNQPLVQGKHLILDNGDLIIQNTEKKDTGIYRCFAQNRFGKIDAVGEVTVRDRTRIESTPMSSQVDYSNPVTFTCAATTDPMESDKLKIRWLKNGELVEPSDRVIIDGNSLTIKDTQSKDTASYTCLAENGLDNDTATATLQVKAVPDPPYNVSVEECLAKQAVIKWLFDEKMRNFDNMTKFIIEYMTDYKTDVWMVAASQLPSLLSASVKLSPFAKYKFRVKAVNTMGISEPSEPTYSWCETPMAIPSKNPDNVHTDESSTGFLVVKWKPMDQIDMNGPKFRYEVEVEEQATGTKQTHVVDGFQNGEKRIAVDNVYRPYNVKVRAVNQVGKAMSSPLEVLGHSGEAQPLVVPENFEMDPEVNVTATSAGFRWDPVDTSPELIQGEFSGYKIRFWKAGEKDTTLREHEHIVHLDHSGSQRGRRDSGDAKIRAVVASLPSYADVEADVVVINKNFESNGSNVVNFSTPEGVPGRVDYLEALYRGSHHFLIQWQKPREQNGIITGYKVSYRKINKLDIEPEFAAFPDLDPNSDRVTVKGLEPDTQYRIYIRARTAKGLGRDYFIDVRTIGIVSSIALPVIKEVSPGTSEANVTWEMTPNEKGDRHGQLYYIEYRKKNSEKWIRFPDPVEGQFWGQLKHLEPGTQYQVRVQAIAHEKGSEHPSESFTFMTAGDNVARASFLTAAWFIGMMVAICVLILILLIVCIIKRNRGDNYPVQEKERLRGAYNDDNQDHFNGFGKGDENGVRGSNSFDRDAEKVPLDEDADSLDYGDDDASKFNEDGSFIGQYGGRGEKGTETTNASSIV